MLEKAERASKNGQSRDTANIENTRHRTKTSKNTTQKNRKMSNTDPPKTC
jgi:hypothetical protein